eukprot:COSAG01_NODE_723_length_14060_cov_132.571807_17_plen_312_part_00
MPALLDGSLVAAALLPSRGVTMASLLLCCCAGGAAAAAVALPAGVLNATAHGGNGGGCEGVVADGTTDVTTALQRCISRAYASNAALFLSPGRYLVSDTLWLNQSSGGAGPVNIVKERFRPNTLFGSTAALPARPTIVLAAHSRGFGNASSPKNVLKVTNPGSEDVNMNQAVRGIDIEVQGGNAGAIALFFHGAQGGLVQDVTVRLANDSFAGFVSSAAPPHRQACPRTPPSVTQKAVIITLRSAHAGGWRRGGNLARERGGHRRGARPLLPRVRADAGAGERAAAGAERLRSGGLSPADARRGRPAHCAT